MFYFAVISNNFDGMGAEANKHEHYNSHGTIKYGLHAKYTGVTKDHCSRYDIFTYPRLQLGPLGMLYVTFSVRYSLNSSTRSAINNIFNLFRRRNIL